MKFPQIFNRLMLLMLAIFGSFCAMAQQKTVTGTVYNQDSKEPLPGVTIGLKGTNQTTLTDAKGQFSILVSGNESVLKFTYVGMAYQETTVGERTNLTITLAEDKKQLEDVVVVGYGAQKKIHLTGAVATVPMKEIQDLPVGSMSAALRGQMAGVNVSGGFGRPGDNATITIRNPSFFVKDGQSTNPIYVIDDIIRTPDDFNALDASEIENISVLKDAAAAVYGILGANGVVVVRTKRGKAGAPKINYTVSYGIADAAQLPRMMNGLQQATYLNSLVMAEKNYIADGTNGYKTDARWYTDDELEHFKNNSTNWLEEAWQPATTMRHALNISGGSEKATYFAGVSYINQTSNFDNINTDRWTFRASSDIKLTTGLKLGLSVSGDVSQNKRYYNKQGSESADNDVKTLVGTPMFNPYYVDGLPVLLTSATNSQVENFHFFEIQRSNNTTVTRTNGLNVQATLNYEVPFIKGLRAGVNYSKNLDNTFGKQFGTRYTVYRFSMLGDHSHIFGGTPINAITLSNGDRVRISPSYADRYQLNATLNYERSFGDHQFSIFAGYEQAETETDAVNAMREGVINGGDDNMNYALGTNTTDETQTEFGRLAYVGRLNYNYASKYLAEFSIRADANPNFAPEYRWGYFPSFSLGWVASQEEFFKRNVSFIDFMKVRASIGWLGTDNTKGFQYLPNYAAQTGKAPVFGGNADRGYAILPNTAIANYQIRWDDNTKYNAGLDLQFLSSRLSVTADAFLDHRTNQLSTLTSGASLLIGGNLPPENFGESKSFGYELSIGWKDNITRDLSYNINTFLSWADNRLIILAQPLGNVGTYLDAANRSSDLGKMGYRYLGMFRSQQQVDDYVAKNPGYTIFGQTPKPGMLYYEDVRGPKVNGQYSGPDGKITEEDLDYLAPKADNHYQLGFNFGVSYKTLSLSVVSGMAFGGQDMLEGSAYKKGTATSNRPEFWKDVWSPDNPNAKYPNPYYSENYDKPSSFWFVSSFAWRIANINLSYTLPIRWTNAAGLGSARAFVVATNPINLYNPYSYRDNSAAYDVYPSIRTVSLGLNLGF
ncbi:TonB-dependent receptor [Paraflavitalea sp. CAU 1676]|uniref:SusC/RagA family TonB-linked outer membrane protein n=1 Tax=Paraflavitalea sp. CAU 1676 TaxID=3032598 RepID=UPI0023D9AE1D|nr:TonB-dependent receptor [Paraflavitalea sp. CAU 1676]MDF2190438.1 TonB-dependent receptor [Paraflavitalea sp. CAU 1676]